MRRATSVAVVAAIATLASAAHAESRGGGAAVSTLDRGHASPVSSDSAMRFGGRGYQDCGIVHGRRGSAKVAQKRYDCDDARELIELKLTIVGDPPGWICRGDAVKITCRKGKQRVKSKVV